MHETLTETPAPAHAHADDDRWRAVVERDHAAEGQFVLAVHTTGIFCRPGCPARTPKRENVSFFSTPGEALRAGFRPCKRCAPTGASPRERLRQIVEASCAQIEASEGRLTVAYLAASAGMSPWHFQRVFKAQTGLTPAQYQRSHRARRLREEMPAAQTVTMAMVEAGYGSSSQFYATSGRALGMTPTAFRSGGAGETIRYGIVETWLGFLLVATTDRGICSLQMGDSAEEMASRLHATFPHAELIADDPALGVIIDAVVSLAEGAPGACDLPLDVRGPAFQHRVWAALRQIPPGSTRTYSEVAEAIGSPRSVRAVAKACADNPVPLVVPCHRVIGKDGSLTGYRYGIARKAALLEREAEAALLEREAEAALGESAADTAMVP